MFAVLLKTIMNKEKHYQSIDLLKFILSIIIVFHHFQQVTGIRFSRFNFFGGAIGFGLAVEFFFIISGFLSYSSIDKIRRISFKDFFVNKYLRFFSMSFISVTCIIIAKFLYYLFRGIWIDSAKLDLFRILTSYLLIFSGGPVTIMGLNNPLWYICVLLICYIILYLIIWLSNKYQVNYIYFIVFICLLGIGIHENTIDLYIPFLNEQVSRGYAAFFFGIILHYIYDLIKHKYIYIVSFIIILFCSLLIVNDYSVFFKYEWADMTFILFPAILFAFLFFDRYIKTINLSFLSKISFNMYFWHSFLLLILSIIDNETGLVKECNNGFAMMLLFTLFTIFFSSIVGYYINDKMSRVLRNFINGIRKE